MKKVYVIGPSKGYARFLDDYKLVSNIEEADIVMLTGGEDINPALYGAKCHPTTYFSQVRDKFEIAEFNKVKENQLVIGTCRGLQLINALMGGLIIQNVYNHSLWTTHPVTDGIKEFEITSLHHQMVYPYNLPTGEYKILWTTPSPRSHIYEGDLITEHCINALIRNGEPELVLYTKPGMPKCLGIQGHPEMMDNDSITVKELNKIINDLL